MMTNKTFTLGEAYPLGDLITLELTIVTKKPLEVILGRESGNEIRLAVLGIPLDKTGIYLGFNTSYHLRAQPPREGHAFGFLHPQQQEIAVIQFCSQHGSLWYEGFAPLFDTLWAKDAYRETRLQLLRHLGRVGN